MKREQNSFKDYEFNLDEYNTELQSQTDEELDEVYVKPVDTSISSLVARGVVPDNNTLFYDETAPPLANMSLMELTKLKQDYKNRIGEMESNLKYQDELFKKQNEESKIVQDTEFNDKTE